MGMTFKDCARNDIGTAFFNNDEFSDLHMVDGKQMHLIIDNNELIERERSIVLNQRSDGLYGAQLLIYVPAAEYGPKPRPGKPLNLDGKRLYTIADCTDEDGIYAMTLEANRI